MLRQWLIIESHSALNNRIKMILTSQDVRRRTSCEVKISTYAIALKIKKYNMLFKKIEMTLKSLKRLHFLKKYY